MAARAAMLRSRDTHDPSSRLEPSASLSSHHHQPVNSPPPHASDVATGDFAPDMSSPVAPSFDMARSPSRGPLQDDITAARGRSRSVDGSANRSASATSLSRGNTLRKQKSLSRKSSLRRSGSRRSVRAGSIGGITYDDTSGIDTSSVYYTPVPTSASPTEVLSNRFQAWRKLLKDLVTYFKEIQASYEARAKNLAKVSMSLRSAAAPPNFLSEGGIGESFNVLRDYYRQSIAETAKAREIENDVVVQLNSLRVDLGHKIKEIKSLSGDFKNTVDKEKESTKKAVGALQEALAAVDTDAKAMVGKDDPFLVRLAVERQVERQIDEENYLHRAYLNLEGSGRELEAIIVGEVQKALNAFATILKKESDDCAEAAETLRGGPISMPRDLEWNQFIQKDPNFISPHVRLRRAHDLEYPGKYHPLAVEVRAGMLERKSKYLKSYTPGWFVLSPTHLHEFKSADAVYSQSPVVSLYLADQTLGAHSQPDSSSHKFILKGRQTGAMHRGHSWVFRAESYDTMLAWYDDIKSLTEKSGEERNLFVRGHSRTLSGRSARSVSSFEDDEADRIPYSTAPLTNGNQSVEMVAAAEDQRPQPGGRFPSDVQLRKDLPPRISSSSDTTSSEVEHDLSTVAGQFHVPYVNTDGKIGSHMVNTNEEARSNDAVYELVGEHKGRTDPSPAVGDHSRGDDPGTLDKSILAPESGKKEVLTVAPVVVGRSDADGNSHDEKHSGAQKPSIQPQPASTTEAGSSTQAEPISAPARALHIPNQTNLTETTNEATRGSTSVPQNAKVQSVNDQTAAGSTTINEHPTVPSKIARKGTDTSISNLPVPGKYPGNSIY